MTWLSETGRPKPLLPMTATLRAAAGLAALGVAVLATPGVAQVVISNQNRGEVTVNSDVLDALGPSRTVPQLIDPGLTGGQTAPPLGAPRPRVSQSETMPRSRVYQLPPGPGGASPPPPPGYVPSVPANTAASAPAPTAPRRPVVSAAAETPPPSMAARAAPARTAVATPPSTPPSVPSSPPPIPPERSAPRAPMTASVPPPYTPPPAPPPAPVARPAPVVASAPPSPPMPAPASPPAAATAPAAGATQVASAGALSRVLFTPGSADLTDGDKQTLAQLAARLGRDADSRIQLLAYADGTPENESQARRLSLSRALAVRSYLIDQGIRSTRVNVQALGIKSAGGPPDRVDAMAATP